MDIKTVTAGEKVFPFKFTKRTLLNFKIATGVDLVAGDVLPAEKIAALCLEAIRTGFKINGQECTLTENELWDLDDQYDIMDNMMLEMDKDEKKQ